ncbi:MAG: hypothetical protein ACI9TY_001433 [Alphaproteobacteria bacterium]|jgi:hypothetical protein
MPYEASRTITIFALYRHESHAWFAQVLVIYTEHAYFKVQKYKIALFWAYLFLI